ncbi:hypothetical protein ONZ51_g8997 [Trametes cubensis]|uniref:Glycosyltransferase family 1 protein n=1 Tax=Trametes cubensis TaxID=1111947 RepID=A0AAD7TM69_9APHY|nr:hypothetical protein ONZ51_g8997 [Trametes cubensis]
MSMKHLVILPFQAVGHVRPLCTLAAHIVKFRPSVTITFFMAASLFPLVQGEIARSFEADDEAVNRIRLIALPQHPNPLIASTYEEAFEDAWAKIAAKEPITCTVTGTVYEPNPVLPKQVILDFFAFRPHMYIRRVAPDVKIYTWFSGSAYNLMYLFGPENLGGLGNLLPKIEEDVAKTGKPFDIVSVEHFWRSEGNVIRVPGLPPMYDYEYQPQVVHLPPELVGNSFVKAHKVFLETDGVLLMGPEALDPEESSSALRQWLNGLGKSVYFSGPLLPDGKKAAAEEQRASPLGEKTIAFLDRELQEKGEKSVLYISFGSIFFPLKPDILATFLEAVMELNIPFILSHPSPFAVFSEELKQKVEDYGHGMFSPWVPQQTILSHPATGWFVTHGGFNSTVECIHAGVPPICWPFMADQTVNTIILTETYNAGYELLEVRTGHGLRPIYRTGKAPSDTLSAVKKEALDVLQKAFGEDGEQKRSNLLAVKARIDRAWEDGGASRRDVGILVDSFAK